MGGIVRGFWLVGNPLVHRGDFNVTRFSNERVGATQLTTAMLEFSDFHFRVGFDGYPVS